MDRRIRLGAWLLLLVPCLVSAQQKDTLVKKLDSLARITPRVYLILAADDIKQQVTSPFRATNRDWLKIGAFGLLTTGTILFADKPVHRLALEVRKNKSMVSASSYVTDFGGMYEAYTLAALGAYGLIFKKEKEKTTTLL